MAHNPLLGKKRIISAVVVVFVIIAAVTAGALLRNVQNKSEDKKSSPSAGITQPPDTTPVERKEVQALINEGKTDEAAAYITQELAKPDLSAQQQHDLYVAQGHLAYDKGDYRGAIASYQKGEAVVQSVRATRSIAEAAEKANDKELAITYYKKAIERLNKNSPVYKDDKTSLETVIKNLGGTL